MLVRWEEDVATGELQGEMRMTHDIDYGYTTEDPHRLTSYRSYLEGSRSGKTVVLNLMAEDLVGSNGTWTGELVKVPEGVNAPPGPAVPGRCSCGEVYYAATRLRDPERHYSACVGGHQQDMIALRTSS